MALSFIKCIRPLLCLSGFQKPSVIFSCRVFQKQPAFFKSCLQLKDHRLLESTRCMDLSCWLNYLGISGRISDIMLPFGDIGVPCFGTGCLLSPNYELDMFGRGNNPHRLPLCCIIPSLKVSFKKLEKLCIAFVVRV
jgi:hypothetical protein